MRLDRWTLFRLRALSKALTRGPGGSARLRAMLKVLPFKHSLVTIDDFDGDLSMHLDLSEHMQSHLFWSGCYSRGISAVLDRLLTPGMIPVDAGANIGEFTLLAAKRVGPQGRVIAYEPVAEIRGRLERNITTNRYANVTVRGIALGAETGTATLYRSCERIRDAGGNITREAGPVKGGSTVIAFVEDPDGYKIELIERK